MPSRRSEVVSVPPVCRVSVAGSGSGSAGVSSSSSKRSSGVIGPVRHPAAAHLVIGEQRALRVRAHERVAAAAPQGVGLRRLRLRAHSLIQCCDAAAPIDELKLG